MLRVWLHVYKSLYYLQYTFMKYNCLEAKWWATFRIMVIPISMFLENMIQLLRNNILLTP